MAKDASSLQSMIGGGTGANNAAKRRQLGSNLGGTATGSPGTTYSQYLKASPGGATATDRGGENTVSPYGTSQSNYNPNAMNQMMSSLYSNPYSFMGMGGG